MSQKSKLIMLLSRETNLDKIRDTFSDCIGLPRVQEGNLLEFSSQTCNIELQIIGSSIGEEEEKFVCGQRNGAYEFVAGVEDADEDIKINLCHYIRQSCTVISIYMKAKEKDADLQEDFLQIIGITQEVMEEIDGILVLAQETISLVNKNNKVILDSDGNSEVDEYFPFVLEKNPKFLENCTNRQKTRRYEIFV